MPNNRGRLYREELKGLIEDTKKYYESEIKRLKYLATRKKNHKSYITNKRIINTDNI